jgi:shikimate kinase
MEAVMNDGPLAVLIGPPGAGKSTVGTLLAGLLGVAFRDTDTDVEAVAGKPVADIFVQDGEPAFRALERDAVAAALREHTGVVALGGGAVLDPQAQHLLSTRYVVYLEAGLQALTARNGLDRPRPLLIGNPRAQLKALLAARLPVYERLASLTVATDDYEPGEIATEIAAKITGASEGANASDGANASEKGAAGQGASGTGLAP